MNLRGLAVPAFVVGSAAAAGYLLANRGDRRPSRARAEVGARIVEEVPPGATLVDDSSTALSELPAARRVIDRALAADAREEWVHVELGEGGWEVVDGLRESEPYYEGNGTAYNGVYVRSDDRIVVLDAIGWTRIVEPVR